MPGPEGILGSLALIANEWWTLAMAWHVVAAAMALALRQPLPSQRTVAIGAMLPLASVSALAWWSGNPFNGSVFAVLAAVLFYETRRLEAAPIDFAPAATVMSGWMLVVFGLVYPHFVITGAWWEYLYAAPFGLIPCPTLAVLAGLSLIVDVFRSRRWALIVASAAAIYGVIGVLVLGVTMDVALIAAAVLLVNAGRHAGRRSRAAC